MLRTLASSVFSLLLVATLFCGGCLSCEQYFMVPGVKACCTRNGQCKTKSPDSQKKTIECKLIALEHQQSVDGSIALPTETATILFVPVPQVAAGDAENSTGLIKPSPPDLQLLYSTFLI